MKFMKYLVLSLLASIGIIIAIFIYFSGSMCHNVVYKEYLSPNKLLKAIVFQRDCGATTSFSTHISIIDFDKSIKNTQGNIYITKGVPKDIIIHIYWQDNDKLVLQVPRGSEYKAENNFGWFNNIKIEYK